MTTTDPTPPELYRPDVALPDAFIVDLDGTLAENTSCRGYLPDTGEDRCGDDDLNVPVAMVVWSLAMSLGWTPLYVTGRTETVRPQTAGWLADKLSGLHGIHGPSQYRPLRLHMRSAGDDRHDLIVKRELFDRHIRHRWHVRLVLDDRQTVVDQWRAMGLVCLQAGPGDF